MAKIPAGVGPRHPQVVVLVGATGDLARRKLLPGLFHLASVGFIPGCRIIGVSLDDIDLDAFRTIARGALDEFSARKVNDADWAAFSASLDYVSLAAGAPNGTTPLMMAAQYGSEESVALLLKRGADAKRRSQLDLSAIDFARKAGREVLAKQLEQAAR